MKRSLTAIIERDGAGYVSLCPELDIASQGDSVEQARTNLREAFILVPKLQLGNGLFQAPVWRNACGRNEINADSKLVKLELGNEIAARAWERDNTFAASSALSYRSRIAPITRAATG